MQLSRIDKLIRHLQRVRLQPGVTSGSATGKHIDENIHALKGVWATICLHPYENTVVI